MNIRFALVLPTLVVLLLAGCGDDTATTTGGGGASSSPGAGPGKGVNASAGPELSLCDTFCAATGACFGDCYAACEAFQSPPCESQGVASVSCLSANYDAASCAPTGCDDELGALFMCRSTVPQNCAQPTCGASALACACTSECSGGEEKVICNLHPDGSAECACYLNGYLGQGCGTLPSSDPNAVDVCTAAANGCCSDFFGPP